MIKFLICIVVVIGISFTFYTSRTVFLEDGIEYAGTTPIQIDISKNNRQTITFYEDSRYHITPMASYDIKAKVLSKKIYKRDTGADISPVDFAFGWEKLSDEFYANHEAIKITQGWRWYKYRYEKEYPLKFPYINLHSANTHIIPANDVVKKQALAIKKGSIVHMTGNLVRVNRDDGWKWQSSLTREDSGAHACEVFYVKTIEIIAD